MILNGKQVLDARMQKMISTPTYPRPACNPLSGRGEGMSLFATQGMWLTIQEDGVQHYVCSSFVDTTKGTTLISFTSAS